MSKEKQIEKMARCICERDDGDICTLDSKSCDCKCTSGSIAELLYDRGYRKQKEGEWHEDIIAFCNVCSFCRAMVDRSAIKCNSGKLHYCPNCGAKMKGGGE